jgi:photosystem II P680 reaction center D1 protein
MAFNLNGLNFNQSMLDTKGHVVNGWQAVIWHDVLSRPNFEVETPAKQI